MKVRIDDEAITRSKADKYNLEQIEARLLAESESLKARPHRSFILPLEDLNVTVFGSVMGDELIVSSIVDDIIPEQEGYE